MTSNFDRLSLKRDKAKKSNGPWRVAFLNTHPIQYFAPMYAHLTSSGEFDVTALYLSDVSIRGGVDRGFQKEIVWDVDLLSGYTPRFMRKADRRNISGFFSGFTWDLWHAIKDGNFDGVIVHGHNLAAHHVALGACLASRTPVFARAETHLRLKRAASKEALRTPLLRSWYKAFDGFLAIGTENARYYQAMGVPSSKINLMPYAVDNERFMDVANRLRTPGARAEARTSMGLDAGLPVILYAAKFEPRKRPDDLILAFRQLQQSGVGAQLLMVGSGELEAKLREMVRSLGISDVHFSGFVNQRELPKMYSCSDVFVLPSVNEPWGLAVNEAMCASLPIVLSEEIGCAEDLVQSGFNGATFPAGDVKSLTEALRPLLLDEDYRDAAGRRSLEMIKRWSYKECAAGLRAALERVHDRHNAARTVEGT
jgi:glycosyltransferase involved in cell wall biosynthesis